MLKEVFEQIKAQEEKAANQIQKARAEARDILKSVESAVAEEERNAIQENRAHLQEHLEKTRKDFAKTLENQMQGKRSAELAKIESCRAQVEPVADFIVERVMQHGTR